MTVSHLAQLRQLQDENAKLKRMCTDPAPTHHALKDVEASTITRSTLRHRPLAHDDSVVTIFIQTHGAHPAQKAYAERFNKTYRTEVLDCCVFVSLQEDVT
ncbi:hypothetical protein [Hydrogenophaga pseudoflava]|uniref:hypothetical protein n=1 Tax=Hydrogenophaga pseudoflava TaxID=47421 RepID=UPI0027E41A7F|nr:hypothetical protein [Hydrogenophaga pseudoflava]MDQ7746414.1 hypothetical protein [Hydrogenophaga pseudoflava]